MLPLAGGDFSNSNHRRQGFPARRFEMRVWRMLLSTRLCRRVGKRAPRNSSWRFPPRKMDCLVSLKIHPGSTSDSNLKSKPFTGSSLLSIRVYKVYWKHSGETPESGQTGQAEICESADRTVENIRIRE